MAESSNISWTDATWNCIVGCSKVSPGCQHCYAETLATRFGWTKQPWTAPHAAENVTLKPQKLNLPRTWKEPKMVFVNSLSDMFHEAVPDDFILGMFKVMRDTPQHTYQILTKRPLRMQAFMRQLAWYSDPEGKGRGFFPYLGMPGSTPLPNVWLGTSVEDQRRADERVPLLVRTPAAVRFLSCEPLLGPVDLTSICESGVLKDVSPGVDLPYQVAINPLTGDWFDGWDTGNDREFGEDLRIHWVIAGGESGSHLGKAENADRWMHPEWARALRDQCADAGVPFFMKQHSALRPGQQPYIIEADGSHTEWHQFPKVQVTA